MIERAANAGDPLAGVRAQIDAGARFVGAVYDDPAGVAQIRYIVAGPSGLEMTNVAIGSNPVPALSFDVPAADWAEREIRDRFGVEFDGIPERRRLLPPEDPAALRRGSSSPELSTVLYGPVRSGIVESARWIIETAGEDFIAVYPSMFFKHRGLEALFTTTPLERATFVAEHVSGATAVSHATCFALAVERALEIPVSAQAKTARRVLLELERIHQHLDALAKLADDGSLAVGAAQTFACKERVHRLLAEAVGNRFSRGVVRIGGLVPLAAESLYETCARHLDRVEAESRGVLEGLFGTQSLLDRLIGTGRLSNEVVRRYAAVGPLARGSQVACDVRAGEPENSEPGAVADEVLESAGDALARASVRAEEIRRSFFIVRDALAAMPTAPVAAAGPVSGRSSGTALARVESPQGELVYFVRIHAERIERVAVRSASFINWPLFVHALPGNIFTDFSFIEHSFGLIQAETDR